MLCFEVFLLYGICSAVFIASKLCVSKEIMVSFREQLANRIICGFMVYFRTTCLACWLMLFAIHVFVFLSKFFISVLPRAAVSSVMCNLAAVTWRFSINVCGYLFHTWLSDFVSQKLYSCVQELCDCCHGTPKVHLT
jgi:hypothetical protein